MRCNDCGADDSNHHGGCSYAVMADFFDAYTTKGRYSREYLENLVDRLEQVIEKGAKWTIPGSPLNILFEANRRKV